MIRPTCLKPMRAGWLATIIAGLVAPTAFAQAPPRPTFTVTQQPDLFYNVWPADLNRDGIADLLAGTKALSVLDAGDVVVAIGKGNGTFNAPVPVAFKALPLIPADFNADGFVDLIILRGRSLEILPGNGDGTFDPGQAIDENNQSRELRAWAFSSDLNGDGRRDLIVPDQDEGFVLKFYPGTGTLSFGPPIVLTTANNLPPSEISSGDFNRDGRRDFALIDLCCEISIYMNGGANTFSRTDIAGALNDITVADLNADGRLDLIGAAGRYDNFSTNTPLGEAVVRLGNGNGTFGPPVGYSTGVRGTTSVVVGDFNGDGRADVATGSRSVVEDDDLGVHLFDSVSILPGDGTGRLGAATSYALAYIRQGDYAAGSIGSDRSSPYWGAHHQLNTADLNGDRRTDLITSPGATLLNRTAAANKLPVVFAGADRTDYSNEGVMRLVADASDPDMDWLTYQWVDDTGRILSNLPYASAAHMLGTTRTYTVTVRDGRGGVARDSVTIHNTDFDADPTAFILTPEFGQNIQAGVPLTIRWDVPREGLLTGFDLSYSVNDGRTFTPLPGCTNLTATARQCLWSNPGPLTTNARLRLVGQATPEDSITISPRFTIQEDPILPNGWSSSDIGAVGAEGTTSFNAGTWRLEGSGADIWGTADAFHYAHVTVGSQFSLTARVTGIENLALWVKAGIMVREDLWPGARHVSLFATPRTSPGLAFQRRLQPGGISTHTAGPAIAPPVWLKVGRSGNTVSAYYRVSPSQPWILIGRQTLPALRNVLYVGLAVTSHVDGQLATATFDSVVLNRGNPLNRTEDVGEVGVAGSTSFDGVVHELQGSGVDVWNTADSFHFAFTSGIYGYGNIASISARVRSVENTSIWAKAGVMFREFTGPGPSTAANARHVMVAVTPGRGVVMQYRPTTGGASVQVAGRAGVAPMFVRLTRSGYTFTGWMSKDGATWQRIGQVTLDGIFADPGLFVTSVNNSTLATATFDEVRLIPF